MPPLGPVTRSASTSNLQTSQDASSDFISALKSLSADDLDFAAEQARLGGQVSPADAELWRAYQGYLRSAQLRDSPALRSQFPKQLTALARDMEKQGGLKKLDERQESIFRASYAYEQLQQRKDKRLSADDAWIVRALSDPKLNLTPENLAVLRDFKVEGSRSANLAELLRPQGSSAAVQTGQVRRPPKDAFERQTAPVPTRPPPRVREEELITVSTVDNPAATPEAAIASRLSNVSKDAGTVAALQQRANQPGAVIDERTPKQVREAYRDFLASRRVADSPNTQREFTMLLGLRGAYLSRTGKPTLSASDERAFLAETALNRLRQRAQLGQSLEPRQGEEWMLGALSDPTTPLTEQDKALLDKVEWRNQGLRTTLGELRANAEENARTQQRPPPGAPFSVSLNADNVFNGGDPQVNAFSQAARAAGYNDAEVERAKTYLQSQGWKLFCKQEAGEPLITKREDAEIISAGGQDFLRYNMTENASLALRDARHSLEQGYDSVAAYREAFGQSWSSVVTGLGESYLAYVQQTNRALGLEDNSVLGPLVRGSYDAIRELTLVGANGAQVAEMATTTFRKGMETGDLFYSVKRDEERNRYFDQSMRQAEETFVQLGKTYPAEETNFAASFARSVVGSAPKMVVSAVPGAVVYYNALKNLNRDFNTFAGETAIDLAGSLLGPLGGRLTSGVTGLASRTVPGLVDNAVANRVVTNVLERGTSAFVGATSNVAQDMGPLAVQNALGNADPEEVKKRLTWEAFNRNVATGAIMGLLMPERHTRDDLVLLSKPGSSIAGPLYGVKKLTGEMDYYAAVKVEGAGAGKPRYEFLQVSPDDPKVRQKLRQGEVTEARQPEVNATLAQSRYENRLTAKGREDLKVQANKYAEQFMLTNAEKGIQLLGPPSPTSVKPSPQTTATPVPPRDLTQASTKTKDIWQRYQDDVIDDDQFRNELLGVLDEVGGDKSVRASLEKLDESAFRNAFREPEALLRVATSGRPESIAQLNQLLTEHGAGRLDVPELRSSLKSAAEATTTPGTPRPAAKPLARAEVDELLSTQRMGASVYAQREKSLLRTLDSSAELEVRVTRNRRSSTERMTAAEALELARSSEVEGVEIRRVLSKPKDASIDALGDKASSEVRSELAAMDDTNLGEAVLLFRSGKAARVYGNRDMLVQAASQPDVMRVELDSGGASWLPTVDQVDATSRTTKYDNLSVRAAQFGEGVRYTSKGSELAGMRVHHGAVDTFESSIRSGPKNVGSGFGGSGLYVAVDGDRRIAEFFADKAASEARSRSQWYDLGDKTGTKTPPKARVLDGVINPDANLRVGKFQIQRDAIQPDLKRGILPPNWEADPELRALIFREFDVLDLRGMKSSGLAMDTDRMLVFHESAGANAIRWEP